MLTSIDHWDWKTDAPEFVPNTWDIQGAISDPAANNQRQQAYAPQSDRNFCIHGGSAQLKAQFEWQMQAKDQQIQDLQARLIRIEEEDARIKAQWDHDRSNLLWQIDRHSEILKRNGIEIDDSISRPEMLRSQLSWSCSGREQRQDTRPAVTRPLQGSLRQDQPLESQMQRLNDLLSQNRSLSCFEGQQPASDQSIVATLQSIFPHATIRASTDSNVGDMSSSLDDDRASVDSFRSCPQQFASPLQ
jgi:hypothetical protein